MSAPMNAPERAALYAPQASADALAACARYADHAGLRIVTIVDEDLPGPTPLAGQALDRLLGRLADGEFEVVVAHAGEGRLVTLAAGVDADARPDPLRCALYVRCASPSDASKAKSAPNCAMTAPTIRDCSIGSTVIGEPISFSTRAHWERPSGCAAPTTTTSPSRRRGSHPFRTYS